METDYSPEQLKDIQSREKEALEHLKRLNLTPSCLINKEKIQDINGGEIFGDRLYPYLSDIKYVRKGDKFVERNENSIESPYAK